MNYGAKRWVGVERANAQNKFVLPAPNSNEMRAALPTEMANLARR